MSEIIRKKHVADIVISICHETEEVDRTSAGKISSVSRSVTANGKLIYQDTMSAAESRVSQDPIKKLIDFLGGRLKSDIYPGDRGRLYFFQQSWRWAFSEKLEKEAVVSYPGRMVFTSIESPYEKLWREAKCERSPYLRSSLQAIIGSTSDREVIYYQDLLDLAEAGLKYKELELNDPDLSSLPIKHPYCKLYNEIGPEILQNHVPGTSLPLDCKKSILQAVRSLHELPKVSEVKLRQYCYGRVPDDTPYSSRLSFAQDLYDWIANSTPESPKEEKEVSDGK